MQCITDCRGWLERESRHGLQQGQNWFLISMLWWQQWKDYVKYVSWTEERLFRRIVWHLTMRIVFVSLYYMTLVYGVPVIQHRNRECTACINLKYHFKQWQGSPCYCLTIQEHKGIVVEQPSILSSLRTPTATEPTPPERVGVLGTFSPVSPTEERSPDAVSSASEATETGDSALFSYHSRNKKNMTRCWLLLSGNSFHITQLFVHTKVTVCCICKCELDWVLHLFWFTVS